MRHLEFDDYKLEGPKKEQPLRYLTRHWVSTFLIDLGINTNAEEALLKLFDISIQAAYEEGVSEVTTILSNISIANSHCDSNRGVLNMLDEFKEAIKIYAEQAGQNENT